MGSINIEKQIVYMQQDGDTLRDKLISVTKTIVKMLIKQFTCGKRLIDIALPLCRQMGWDGIDIFHPHKNVCPTCWHIQTLAFAPQTFYASPNNLRLSKLCLTFLCPQKLTFSSQLRSLLFNCMYPIDIFNLPQRAHFPHHLQ